METLLEKFVVFGSKGYFLGKTKVFLSLNIATTPGAIIKFVFALGNESSYNTQITFGMPNISHCHAAFHYLSYSKKT